MTTDHAALVAAAESEVNRLKSEGWTRQDFAAKLKRELTVCPICAEVECDPDCPNNPDAPQCPGCGKPEAACIYETPGCADD